MKILFMGTPDIAKHCLEALLDSGYDICGVFTKPDAAKGRGMKESASPVKELATGRGIPVFQPTKMKKSFEIVRELAPDLIVVVAYGRLLPKTYLDYPQYGCINLHASLLPKLRGAAPIQRAILNGDTVGGVTTMFMAEEMDAGDMLMTERVDIMPDDTTGSLTEKYAEVGGKLLIKTIEAVIAGSIIPIPQNHTEATFAPPVEKQEGEIDWVRSARQIRDLIRGFNPAPVAFTYVEGEVLKAFSADIGQTINADASVEPGTIVNVSKGLEVATGDGTIILTEVQAAGKKRMNAADWMRGKRLQTGAVLGKDKQ